MGHGCYYTHRETGTRAFWIDTTDIENNDDMFEFLEEVVNIHDIIVTLGYERVDTYEKGICYANYYQYTNGLYILDLGVGHNNQIVFMLNPRFDDHTYNLAIANHQRSCDKIARALIKAGYELRIATSGYTSGIYEPPKLKGEK